MPNLREIEYEIDRYCTEASNSSIDPRLTELFFPVDERSIYWEWAEERGLPEPGKISERNECRELTIWDLNKKKRSDKKPIDPEWTDRYYAIVDREENQLFTIVSESYLLVDNKMAYWIALALAKYLFKKPDTNENFEFVPFKKWLRKDRAACEISICRSINYNQPNLIDGWCSGVTMLNSYNKSVALTYYVGFFNPRYRISILLPGYSISLKLKKDRNNSIPKQIATQLAGNARTYKIQEMEKAFLEKLDNLKKTPMAENMFLAFFCKFFHISKKSIERQNEVDEARRKRTFINEKKELYVKKYGQNAYAFLLGISDYISNYDDKRFNDRYLFYHIQAGEWADNYLEESSKPDFSLYKYIGEEAINTAAWLNLL